MKKKIIIELKIDTVAVDKVLDKMIREILNQRQLRWYYNIPKSEVVQVDIYDTE